MYSSSSWFGSNTSPSKYRISLTTAFFEHWSNLFGKPAALRRTIISKISKLNLVGAVTFAAVALAARYACLAPDAVPECTGSLIRWHSSTLDRLSELGCSAHRMPWPLPIAQLMLSLVQPPRRHQLHRVAVHHSSGSTAVTAG